jgi:hypothetical protein
MNDRLQEAISARAFENRYQCSRDPWRFETPAKRAPKVRHLIERWCTEILDRFGRATGPQLLAYDAQAARQFAALALYIRQCHAERDLEAILAQ